jgi:hypothetical protein
VGIDNDAVDILAVDIPQNALDKIIVAVEQRRSRNTLSLLLRLLPLPVQ